MFCVNSAGRARWPRRATSRGIVASTLAAALALAGCGADEIADRPTRPPSITVSATISAHAVTVSPSHFAARTIELLISNQTSSSRQLVLRSERLAGGGDALAQTSGPINPGGTISLQAALGAGDYVASIRGSAIAPATITVDPARAAAADELLTP
jgi:hypothetical protein